MCLRLHKSTQRLSRSSPCNLPVQHLTASACCCAIYCRQGGTHCPHLRVLILRSDSTETAALCGGCAQGSPRPSICGTSQPASDDGVANARSLCGPRPLVVAAFAEHSCGLLHHISRERARCPCRSKYGESRSPVVRTPALWHTSKPEPVKIFLIG